MAVHHFGKAPGLRFPTWITTTLKVKLLSIQPSPAKQGPAIQHLRFLTELKKYGILHYLVLEKNHPMSAEFESVSEDILWVTGNREGIIPRTASPLKIMRYFWQTHNLKTLISQFAVKNQVDLLWTVNEAYLAGPLSAKNAQIPCCTQVFGMTSFRTPVIGKLLALFHKKYSHAIIPCQDLIASEIQDLGYPAEKIDVVYNGVDTSNITASITNTTQCDNNDPANRNKVGMVAGLDPRKGHILFIEAAPYVLQKTPDTSFHLIGSTSGNDEYLEEIRHKISELNLQDNVILTGKVDNVYDYINALDIYCIPSKIEALSVAGLEAMALDKPIVATDVGGNYIAVKNDETGILTPATHAKEPRDAISYLLLNPELIKKYGIQGRKLVEKKFTLENSGKKLNDIFIKYVSSFN